MLTCERARMWTRQLSTLMTVLPNTTFSQNNGVISLTRCANRRAGYCWFVCA